MPLSRWSCPDLATEAVGRGITEAISAAAIRRILAADAIKPWQYRSWLFIRDPDFAAKAYPSAVMVHTPIYASWLSQVEIFFSVAQRTVVTPNDFTNLDQVQDRLAAFEQRYNATARPFTWKFTPADLDDLMTRIERHEQKKQNQQHPTRPSACPAGRRLITPEGLPAQTTKSDHEQYLSR